MKSKTSPVIAHLAALLGAMGILLCLSGCFGVWYVEWRVNRARERLFENIDQGLAKIDTRLVDAQSLAAESKITLLEIEDRIQNWTKNEASKRLADRLDIETNAQQLATGLRQVEVLLDSSLDAAEQVRQALAIGSEIGLSVDEDSIDSLLLRLADFKVDLGRAISATDSVRQRIHEGGDDASMDEPIKQSLKIASQFLATFGKVDSRLATFRGRLTAAQNTIRKLDAKTHVGIIAAAVILTLLLLWMAAGQVCLWRWARKCRASDTN